jgi:hypothetical protein
MPLRARLGVLKTAVYSPFAEMSSAKTAALRFLNADR